MTFLSIRDAFASPLGFPPLTQIVFPGDRVLIAPDADNAGKSAILLESVHVLLEAGLAAEEIGILFDDDENDALEALRPMVPEGVRLVLHQPNCRDRLAMLGVNDRDEAIVLARELVDADMVLTIGRFRRRTNREYFGVHSAIFPRFSDLETRRRFRTTTDPPRRLQAEVEEVAKQLGISFTIQEARNGRHPYLRLYRTWAVML